MKNDTPRVLNLRCDSVPPGAVYIGRGRNSPWGNRYVIGRDGSRAEVIRKFTENQLPDLLPRIHLLRGKDLVCFCAPEDCHGDILLAVANVPCEEEYPEDGTFKSFRNWPYVAGLTYEVTAHPFVCVIDKLGLLETHGMQVNFIVGIGPISGFEAIDGEERLVVLFGDPERHAYTSVEFRNSVHMLLSLGG